MSAWDDDAVTQWAHQALTGDEAAAARLWERYFPAVMQAARRRLGSLPRREADEEDVAASVFESFFRGADAGRFQQLSDRSDLWRILAAIAHQKAVNQIRHTLRQKRGGGAVRGESVFEGLVANDGQRAGLENAPVGEPGPEFIAICEEECERLLNRLADDSLRQTAQLRLAGLSNAEIAQRLQVSLRSVERKLQLIRDTWMTAQEP